MQERNDAVSFKGNPLTLVGKPAQVGDQAPGFTVLDGEVNPVSLSDFAGRVVVVCSVPSIDTPVCDTEARRFNDEAAGLGGDVVILVVSMDLPFAQSRWCGAAGIDRVRLLSDHRDASFGQAYGLLIKELRLLARAVIVIDRGGTIAYTEVVDDITHEPNYEAARAAVQTCLDKENGND